MSDLGNRTTKYPSDHPKATESGSLELDGVKIAGRYLVDRRLGEGGMGTVFLAFDLELNRRPVVLKFPDPASLRDPTFRARFLMEIRSLASLDHPNIIKIHDAGEHEEIPYAVVQYAGGGDLSQRLSHGVSTPQEILLWLSVVAEALDFMHRKGYCHRDVKPANIFLDKEGHAFLSDFGIATGMAEVEDSDSQLTSFGFFVGSPRYGPPEAMKRELSPAYDQYSLAVTAYEVMSREVPVTGDTVMDMLMAKSRVPPRDIRELLPDFPAGAAEALNKALAMDPNDRFDSCTDFYKAFAAGIPGGSKVSTRRGFWAALAVTTSLALIYLLVRQAGSPTQPAAPTSLEREQAPPVVTSLHKVQTGSSQEEFDDAMALCRQYDPSCDAGSFMAETPRSSVLAPYALDLYEVSNAEFASFVEMRGYRPTSIEKGFSYHRNVRVPDLSWHKPGKDGDSAALPAYPVVHVSWFDAQAFCEAAGMRLPSEEEWEFAARGDEKRVFPWGDQWEDDRASWGHAESDGVEMVSGRAKGATQLGHQHMSGNVAEWTASSVDGDRVMKGGSWLDDNPARLRPAARMAETPDYTSSDLGIRCLRELIDDE